MNKKIIFILLLSINSILFANSFTIAAGKGYKKPITKIVNEFKSEKNIDVQIFFGNMKQIIMQAKNSGKISILIADKRYLSVSSLKFSKEELLGHGQMVMAYKKGLKIQNPIDILRKDIKKIAIPKPEKTIWGRAASEFFKTNKIEKIVNPKLLRVSSSPQVLAYVISGDVDVGFTNIAVIEDVKDKVGGYVLVDKKTYKSISIVASEIEGFADNRDVNEFMKFLKTNKVENILKEFSLR